MEKVAEDVSGWWVTGRSQHGVGLRAARASLTLGDPLRLVRRLRVSGFFPPQSAWDDNGGCGKRGDDRCHAVRVQNHMHACSLGSGDWGGLSVGRT